MKYTGRITLSLISLFASFFEFIIGVSPDTLEIFFNIVYTVIAWLVGGMYDKLKFLSENDFLTGAYNRRYVKKVASKLMTMAKLKKESIGFLMIDVNNFKLVNDTLGHRVGDKLLVELSRILKQNTRKSDLVARWGGDEFLILTPKIDRNELQRLVKRITLISKKNAIEYSELKLGVSIGYAIYPDDGLNFDDLVNLADKKMYNFKS
jgi:diguanylate cyclase (GGDEF)-like protein